jgi:hypothetical protein
VIGVTRGASSGMGYCAWTKRQIPGGASMGWRQHAGVQKPDDSETRTSCSADVAYLSLRAHLNGAPQCRSMDSIQQRNLHRPQPTGATASWCSAHGRDGTSVGSRTLAEARPSLDQPITVSSRDSERSTTAQEQHAVFRLGSG